MKNKLFLAFLFTSILYACTPAKQIAGSARQTVLEDAAVKTAHVGISIYEPATGKYLYNYQGDKYFIPASNTKLPTCYAAMKYLGDSLVGARVTTDEQGRLRVFPTGDPSFLNAEFKYQPLFEKLKGNKSLFWNTTQWQEQRWGSGWAWNDYDAAYMAERSPFPIYGNIAHFYLQNDTLKTTPSKLSITASPGLGFEEITHAIKSRAFTVERSLDDNNFILRPSASNFSNVSIPLRTDGRVISVFLEDTLNAEVVPFEITPSNKYSPTTQIIHSQPTDSLLKPMMHRSDNFFAEQSLLMVSNEKLGFMSDAKIIDTLLKTDFKDLPQKPRWVDGSGLSRYNLFTPQDFVVILNKMRTEFGMKRVKEILPTGNEGTLSNYYKAETGYIFGKTGTLSGVVAFSGFLYTKKDKLLIFSVLVNNHQASATAVRRAVEIFIERLRNQY